MDFPVTRIFDLIPRYQKIFDPKDDVIAGKENGEWKKYNITQYIENTNLLSSGLLQLGIQKGDTIATIINNCPEWNFLDMAITQIGAIHVPIYPTITENDYQYILNHAGIKLVFVATEDLLKKVERIKPSIPSLLDIYALKKINGAKTLADIYALGNMHLQLQEIEKIKNSILPNDCFTIIYTSGTTGNAKGVMLSHNNIISNFVALSYIPTFGQEGKALSFLPLCHVYERTLNYLYQYLGISIYYAENLGTVGDNIKEIKPDMMCAVPRLLEKVYDKFIANGRKQKGLKKMIFFWAVKVGSRYELNNANGKLYAYKLKIANKLVLSKWKEALGGNFKIIVSGGASLQTKLARLYRASGLPVYEGYGLTETSPVIAVTSTDPNGIKFGTVGPPLRGVEMKIAHDGEIVCRGPNIMLGYYKNEALTQSVIDSDGWFHTGDLGKFEPEGQLRITGRKKEIFKTSLGKYIAPELIENKIKESPFIDNLIVVGENQRFAAAIVLPDFIHLRNWCAIKEIPYTTNEEIIKLPRIKQRYLKEINKFNKELGKTERISKIEIISDEWSQLSGELTPTLKLKRNVITTKYQDLINTIFSSNSFAEEM
ncbi:MAG: long-chain fatty acid--CoA ligase [Lentimicrobiaceae bacterium]|nr:long-chain fatty acid--CoA ligase [Lentimicrobiaceae bacterium]